MRNDEAILYVQTKTEQKLDKKNMLVKIVFFEGSSTIKSE